MDHTVSTKYKTGLLLLCCTGLLMSGIDAMAVNLALPTIQRQFHVTVTHLQWVIDAYTITLATLLILTGSLGDRWGRKRIFQLGLSIFGLGSLLCSVAISADTLIMARVIQAIGGSALTPVALSIISNLYPDPKARAKAIGVWGATIGLSLVLGPVIGGVLVQFLGWRSIFWINIPLVIASVSLCQRYMPESRAEVVLPFDKWGQLLIMIFMISLIASLIAISQPHRTLGWVEIGFGIAALGLMLFIWVEKNQAYPLINLHFFKHVNFSLAIVISIVSFACMGGFSFLMTLYLQEIRHLSVLQTAMVMLPQAVVMLVMPIVSGHMVAQYGVRRPLLVASIGMIVGFSLLRTLGADSSMIWIIFAFLVFGAGFGFLNAPINNAAIAGMPRSQSGTAGAIAGVSRMFGSAFGVALFGSIVQHALHRYPFQSGFVYALHHCLDVMIVFAIVVFILACLTQIAHTTSSAHHQLDK